MSKTKIKTGCVRMIANELKAAYQRADSINTLPVKCRHCGLPDIDFVPEPYLLTKDIPRQAGMAPALHGNYLVRERVRRMLELAVPDACTFHRTTDARSRKTTDLWLAVPNHTLKALYPSASRPLCPRCRASKWGVRLAETWKIMNKFDSEGIDVFKSSAWQTLLAWGDPTPPNRVCYQRDLYFSVRLDALLNRLGVNPEAVGGRLEHAGGDDYDRKTSREDQAWIEEKLKLLDAQGLGGGYWLREKC